MQIVVKNPKPKIWHILIGVNKYSNSRNSAQPKDLKYPADGCQKIAKVLNTITHNYLNNIGQARNIELRQSVFHDVFDPSDKTIRIPSKENVEQELEKICQEAGTEDIIIFYFAGHGDKKEFLYLADTSKEDPESGLKLKELVNKLSNSNAKEIVLFIDACYSERIEIPEL